MISIFEFSFALSGRLMKSMARFGGAISPFLLRLVIALLPLLTVDVLTLKDLLLMAQIVVWTSSWNDRSVCWAKVMWMCSWESLANWLSGNLIPHWVLYNCIDTTSNSGWLLVILHIVWVGRSLLIRPLVEIIALLNDSLSTHLIGTCCLTYQGGYGINLLTWAIVVDIFCGWKSG